MKKEFFQKLFSLSFFNPISFKTNFYFFSARSYSFDFSPVGILKNLFSRVLFISSATTTKGSCLFISTNCAHHHYSLNKYLLQTNNVIVTINTLLLLPELQGRILKNKSVFFKKIIEKIYC